MLKLVSWIVKAWLFGLFLFIGIGYIVPKERPFAQGVVFVRKENLGREVVVKKNNSLYISNSTVCIRSLSLIKNWMVENNLKKIVFIIPQYEFIIFYLLLNQQKQIDNKLYSLGTFGEKFQITKILFLYHQSLGFLIDFLIDLFSDLIRGVFRKNENLNLS